MERAPGIWSGKSTAAIVPTRLGVFMHGMPEVSRCTLPATFFHTGLHPDYHRYTDTPDKIDYPKLERIARLVYLTSRNLADQEERPRLDRDL